MVGCCPSLGRSYRVHPAEDSGEVLLLGCEQSGKTLLSRHLQVLAAASSKAPPLNAKTQPTIGTEIAHLAHKHKAFTLREVGGSMMPVWPRFFEACRAVVFVADSSSEVASGSPVVEWHNLLAAPPLQSKPALLIFNKRDSEHALPDLTLRTQFRMSELDMSGKDRAITVLPVSALTGDGLAAVLDWIAEHLT
tara:strand:+ start:73 stop:651 length:579 start_codon:yes stop_codon:yes gene_type:complete